MTANYQIEKNSVMSIFNTVMRNQIIHPVSPLELTKKSISVGFREKQQRFFARLSVLYFIPHCGGLKMLR